MCKIRAKLIKFALSNVGKKNTGKQNNTVKSTKTLMFRWSQWHAQSFFSPFFMGETEHSFEWWRQNFEKSSSLLLTWAKWAKGRMSYRKKKPLNGPFCFPGSPVISDCTANVIRYIRNSPRLAFASCGHALFCKFNWKLIKCVCVFKSIAQMKNHRSRIQFKEVAKRRSV